MQHMYKLIEHNSPLLKQVTEKFDFSNPPTDPVQLYNDLAKIMIDEGGIGLSANQVGLPYRFFVLRAEQVIGCFNPIIVDQSSEMVMLEEGCLSFPGLMVKIKRPRRIKVRFAEPDGQIYTKVFDGMTARAFQHELSHLDGRTMFDDCSYIERERAKKKWIQLQRKK